MDELGLNSPGKKFKHRMCIGFQVYVSKVGIDGMDWNAELIGNVFPASCLHNKLDDLFFPLGEFNFFSLKHIPTSIGLLPHNGFLIKGKLECESENPVSLIFFSRANALYINTI